MTAPESSAQTELRLDVWLWRARFYKSRALSTRTIREGKIRRERFGHTLRTSKPNTLIRPGDRLTFIRADKLYHIQVLELGTRRGPYEEAKLLYTFVDTTPKIQLTA